MHVSHSNGQQKSLSRQGALPIPRHSNDGQHGEPPRGVSCWKVVSSMTSISMVRVPHPPSLPHHRGTVPGEHPVQPVASCALYSVMTLHEARSAASNGRKAAGPDDPWDNTASSSPESQYVTKKTGARPHPLPSRSVPNHGNPLSASHARNPFVVVWCGYLVGIWIFSSNQRRASD